MKTTDVAGRIRPPRSIGLMGWIGVGVLLVMLLLCVLSLPWTLSRVDDGTLNGPVNMTAVTSNTEVPRRRSARG